MGMLHRLFGRSHKLGGTTDGIGIFHRDIGHGDPFMFLENFLKFQGKFLIINGHVAAGQKIGEIDGSGMLARVIFLLMDSHIKGIGSSHEGFNGKGSDNIGIFQCIGGFCYNRTGQSNHARGSIDKGQPFLGIEVHEFDAGSVHGFFSRHDLSLEPGFPFTKGHTGNTPERTQIPAGSQRPFSWNQRKNLFIDHIQINF